MAGIFGQTQVAEQAAAPEPVAPVQDRSPLVAADALTSVAKVGASIFTGVAKTKAKGALAEYEKKQLALADAVEQGKPRRAALSLFRRNVNEMVTAHPELVNEINDLTAKIGSTSGLGKVIMEQSEDEKNAAKQRTAASDAGWVRPNMTEEQKVDATNKYLDYQLVTQKMTRDNLLLERESKNVGLDTAKLALLQARRRENSIQNLSSLADRYLPKFNNDMQGIVDRYNKGEIDQKTALLEIQSNYSVVDTTLRSVGKDAGGDYLANLAKPMTDMKALTEQLVSGKIDEQVFQNELNHKVAIQQAMIGKDPQLVKLIATSKLFPNSDLITMGDLSEGVVRYLSVGTDGTNKNVDPTPSTPKDQKDFKTALSVVKQSINRLSDGSAKDSVGTLREVDTFVVDTLKGVSAYKDAVDKPSDYNQVVEFLASPEFASYVVKNGLPADIANNAKNVLKQQYADVVSKAVKKEYEDASLQLYNQFDPRVITYQVDNKRVPATDLIEPYWNGSGMAFRTKEGVRETVDTRGTLRQLNDKPAKLINRLIRLEGNLNGNADYKKVFEDSYLSLFGVEQNKDNNK